MQEQLSKEYPGINIEKVYSDFEKKLPKDHNLSEEEKQKLFRLFCAVSKAYFDRLD